MATEKKIYRSFVEISKNLFPDSTEKTKLSIEEIDAESIGRKIGNEIISNAKQQFKI